MQGNLARGIIKNKDNADKYKRQSYFYCLQCVEVGVYCRKYQYWDEGRL